MNGIWLRRLYVALAIVAVAPVWSAQYLPTVDGPSHVYNSWILRELIRGDGGIVGQSYAIDWRPHPNWTGHAAMALLMTVVPPPIAEKLLVSGIVLLFLYAMWLYAGAVDESRRPFALVAFPFAYSLMLQMGFYNFCISVALYFIVLAVWWRRRDRPDARTIALVAALLLLCYFSHLLSTILAVVSIGLLWLVTLPGRRPLVHARHLIALVPVLPLLAWFIHARGVTTEPAHRGVAGTFRYIMLMWPMFTIDGYQARLGQAIFFLLAALIAITFARRQWTWNESDGFILVTLAIIAIYARSPVTTSGGTMIFERMALFVVLSPLVWLAPRLPRRAMVVVVIVLATMSLAYTGYLARRYRGLSRRIAELVRSTSALGRDSTVLPLIRDVRPMKGTFLPVLMHAFDYAALEKGDIDVANYEPGTGYFPIRFRPGVFAPDLSTIETTTSSSDLAPYVSHARYIYLWHVRHESPLIPQLEIYYDDLGGSDGGRVYRVKQGTSDGGKTP